VQGQTTWNIFHGVRIRYSTGRCRVIEYAAFIRGRGWCARAARIQSGGGNGGLLSSLSLSLSLSFSQQKTGWQRRETGGESSARGRAGRADRRGRRRRGGERGPQGGGRRRRRLARCVPLFRGFIAAVGINEGPCFHGDRVAVQISFYYLPRGIYLATSGRPALIRWLLSGLPDGLTMTRRDAAPRLTPRRSRRPLHSREPRRLTGGSV